MSSVEPDRRFRILQTFLLWMIVLAVHVALRIFGFAMVRSMAAVFARPRRFTDAIELARVERWRSRIRVIKRKFPKKLQGNCLSQSIVLWGLLQRDGIASNLIVGATKRSDEFQAHAWVEHEGRPVNAGLRVRQKFQTFDHDLSSGFSK